MRHIKLSEHIFKKGKFITPFNNLPMVKEFEDEKSWAYGRMPEYLWIGLILNHYGRDEGLRKSYTPYIRYPVSLHYVNLLSENILDKEFMSKLCFKMNIAFAVHQLCDKDKLASVGFERFLEKQQQYDFDKKLLHALSMHGINEENFENRIVPQIITDELEKFYSTLLVSE